jgi:hypothetical protein
MARSAKFARILLIYVVLNGLIFLAFLFDYNKSSVFYPGLTDRLENYFSYFFTPYALAVIIGFIFGLVWTLRQSNQRHYAKWFRFASIASITICLLVNLLGIALSEGESAWYVLSSPIKLLLTVLSATIWTGITISIYKYMIKNSNA